MLITQDETPTPLLADAASAPPPLSLDDPGRLKALDDADLLDSPAEEAFDRLTRLASRFLRAPVSLVSLVDVDRQFFKSATGLAEPWVAARETPLSLSFCRHVVSSQSPLIVTDAANDSRVHDNRAIAEMGVRAYAGIPLATPDGHVLGSFCVIDHAPRHWSAEELDALRDLAGLAATEIALRRTLKRAKEQAEAADREHQEKSALLEAVPDGIYGIDREGRCTFINSAGLGMIRYEPEQVLGRNMHELIHHRRPDGSPYPESECPIFKASVHGEGCRIDDEVLWRSDGKPFVVEYTSAPIIQNGRIQGAVVTMVNIAPRKQWEGLREDLTRMIVHDLRTPLTSLITGLQTLKAVGDLDEEQTEILDISLTGGGTLLDMVNELLDISQAESGGMKLEKTETEAASLIEAAVSQVAATIEEKSLRLVQDVSPADLPAVCADEEKLRRTLVNLIGNAVKFTPASGTITLSARHDAAENAVRFSVRDTGEGIPAEAFEKIFEKFGQVESRKAGRKMSTGLGLTFCKMAVEAHGGRIWVESTLGEGSVFHFTIPVTECA